MLLSDTLGEAPLHSAWQRALGTVVGIVIAYLAFRVLPEPGEGGAALNWPASQMGAAGGDPREERR